MFRKKIKPGDMVAMDTCWDAKIGKVISRDNNKLVVFFESDAWSTRVVSADKCIRISQEEYERYIQLKTEKEQWKNKNTM